MSINVNKLTPSNSKKQVEYATICNSLKKLSTAALHIGNHVLAALVQLRTYMACHRLIALRTGYSRETVLRALKELSFLIGYRHRFKNGRQKSNIYFLQEGVGAEQLRWLAQFFTNLRKITCLMFSCLMPVSQPLYAQSPLKAWQAQYQSKRLISDIKQHLRDKEKLQMSHHINNNEVIYKASKQATTKYNFEERTRGNVSAQNQARRREMSIELPISIVFNEQQRQVWASAPESIAAFALSRYKKAKEHNVKISDPAAWIIAVVRGEIDKVRPEGRQSSAAAPKKVEPSYPSRDEKVEYWVKAGYRMDYLHSLLRQAEGEYVDAKSSEQRQRFGERIHFFSEVIERKKQLGHADPQDPTIDLQIQQQADSLYALMPDSVKEELMQTRAKNVHPLTRNNPVLDIIVKRYLAERSDEQKLKDLQALRGRLALNKNKETYGVHHNHPHGTHSMAESRTEQRSGILQQTDPRTSDVSQLPRTAVPLQEADREEGSPTHRADLHDAHPSRTDHQQTLFSAL